MPDRPPDDAAHPSTLTETTWVSPFNFGHRTTSGDASPRTAYIYDVTLRDGEQMPGVAFDEDERVRIGVALAELGVARIETGLPSLSESVFAATQRLGAMDLPAQFVPMCRAESDDVRRTAETGTGAITIVHTINPLHCRHVFGLEPEDLLDRIRDAVRFAKDQGLHTTFMASDVFRCERGWIEELYGTVARDGEPDAMVVTDTVGCATPWAVETVFGIVRGVAEGIPLEYHGHDDFGLGTATALAAVRAGAAGVHTSFNGLGERTGNAPTEEVVAALELAMDVRTGIDLGQILAVSELIEDISGVPVPAHKPVTGRSIFATESHVVGLIQAEMHDALGIDTGMFAYAPSVFGHGEVRYLVGKGSGPTAIDKACERLGLDLTDAEKAELLDAVKRESRLRKAVLSDRSVRYLAQGVAGGNA